MSDGGGRIAGGPGRTRARLLALLTVGLLVPGVARWWLGVHGDDALGLAVFVVGYTLTLALVWHGWLRGRTFVGPDG